MSEVDGRALENQGRAAHAAGEYADAATVYEEAFGAYRTLGDLGSAARCARTVGWFRGWVFGEWAVHRGWVARARRLLEAADDDHGRGWVVLDDALTGSDLEVQRSQYLEAIEVARRTGDNDLECDAIASLGMMLVFSDRVDEGMAYLDEALAAICGGDVSELPVVEGCLCGLITACERTRDVSRAEEWLRAAERVMQRGHHLAVAGHCRSHYAGILVAAGRWADAEDELTAALDLLPEGLAVRERAQCRLADLRLRQGRLEEAEQLVAGLGHHEDAVLTLAALHLARARHDLAIELLDRALDSRPLEDHETVRLLALRVEAHLAAGDLEAARRSGDLLGEIATDQTSNYVRAVSATARARLCAASEDRDARACWHQAMAMYTAARMPAEVASARLELAGVIAVDRPSAAIAELEEAHRAFEEIGARGLADQAAAMLRELGGPIKTGPKRGTELTRREDEVLELLALGFSNAGIAERLYISPKTAEHHVGRILSKLGLQRRAEVAAYVAHRPDRPPEGSV
jgi:DNA-binding NarL/FixJ family response regulator